MEGSSSGTTKEINIENKKKKVLIISTNLQEEHFNMNQIFVNLLAKHYNVHFIIIKMKDEEISKENLNIGIEKNNFKLIERNWLINKNSEENKISQINGNTFEIFPFIDILEYENPRISKIMKLEKGKNIRNKNYQNTRDYLKKLNKAIIEQETMFEEKEFIESLKERNFDLALFDTINIGALFVFYAVGIKNVFAINNTPLLLHQFYFANKPIPYDTVPDVYITVVNDPEQRKQNYNNIINAFKNFYSDIGQKFNKNHPQINMPTIGNLYSKIKALFLNTDEVIDFPLGESKPNNLYYVGGIHLNNDFRIKLANLIGKEKYKERSKDQYKKINQVRQALTSTQYFCSRSALMTTKDIQNL
uniref:glucuronosyltransferase n=1 Tax=Meloidogyne hapla TaxID=6305 RepID=A0A1I8BG60_MELHA